MTSGNPILDKNLEFIEKYNPQLKEKLLDLPYLTNKIDLIETKLQEANLIYNEIPLHSQDGAEIEAKKAFEEAKNTPSSRHVVFGIGIGYLFKECCERSKGKVFLYEPNLEILRVTLELVDFSKELSQENVFIASEIEKFKDLYNQNYTYKANSSFLALNSYRYSLYAKETKDIMERINVIVGTCALTYNNLIGKDLVPIETIFKNLPYTLNATPLCDLKDIYKGKTALVISAGPTLDLNIETIKKNRDKLIIFCVGTAFKSLMSKGITPDFVNIIENDDSSGQLLGCDLSDVNLILEPYTHNATYLLKVKRNFLYASNNCDVNNYWASLTGVDISQYLVKGTVSYAALASAKMLGFSKLILVGQDLAYLNNQCYSTNASSSDMIFEINPETKKPKLNLKNRENYVKSLASADRSVTQAQTENYADRSINYLQEILYHVKGINGDLLPTTAPYATFVEFFSEFAYNNQNLDLINTSMVGAQIDGFKNIPLEEALKDVSVVKKIELPEPFEYDKVKILANLNSDIEMLTNILNYFITAREYIFRYETDLEENKVLTREAIECIKLLLSLYEKINDENQTYLYKTISFKENIEIVFELNEAETFEIDKVETIFGLLKTYYGNVEKKLLSTLEKIKITKEIINESVNSKSQKCVCNN